MTGLENLLSGNDLRSVGKCDEVIQRINSQRDFNKLFTFLFHNNRVVVMHAADAIEKITIEKPQYLTSHKKEVLGLLNTGKDKELKWHLALMVSRLPLETKEVSTVWLTLNDWANNKTNSKLVRVGALQGLYELAKQETDLLKNLNLIMVDLEKENIPSLNARIRNIRKELIS